MITEGKLSTKTRDKKDKEKYINYINNWGVKEKEVKQKKLQNNIQK